MASDRQKGAIAKFQWKNKEYYMRQKRVTIGRHSSKGQVDVDLGNSNYISRAHLEVFFEGSSFFLKCNGKNGIFVNDAFLRPEDDPQPLPAKCIMKFPSSGMFVGFLSLVAEPLQSSLLVPVPGSKGRLWKSCPASPALSPAATISAGNSRPGSPPAEVAPPPPAPGPPAAAAAPTPLLHHSYSSGPPPAAEQPLAERGYEETIEDDADDGSTKPPFSYAQLIAQAITTAKNKQLTLSGIYAFITRNYPFYRYADKGWQNSIRHNLSLNRFFVKVSPRVESFRGKGCYWRVEESAELKMADQAFRRRRHTRRMRYSTNAYAGVQKMRPHPPTEGSQDLPPGSPAVLSPLPGSPLSSEASPGREDSPAPAAAAAPDHDPAAAQDSTMKMDPHCGALNCSNTRLNHPGMLFHRFPNDAAMCSQWLVAAGRGDMVGVAPQLLHDKARLCADHFAPDQYQEQGRLRPDALPRPAGQERREEMKMEEAEAAEVKTEDGQGVMSLVSDGDVKLECSVGDVILKDTDITFVEDCVIASEPVLEPVAAAATAAATTAVAVTTAATAAATTVTGPGGDATG